MKNSSFIRAFRFTLLWMLVAALCFSLLPVQALAETDAAYGQLSEGWTAKWIWTSDNLSRHNWMCARKSFSVASMEEVSEQVLARIAVDSRYWLWINGEQVIWEGGVKRGPTEDDTYMEYVDITPFLREGENCIAVLAWYYGEDEKSNYYSYNPSGQAGFLFEADLGDGTVIISDASWKVLRHKGYLISTEENNPGSQGNFRLCEGNILYDAQAAEAAGILSDGTEIWMLPEFEDSGWESAIVYGNAGDAPWNNLYIRPIPQLYYSEKKSFLNPDVYAKYQDVYTEAETELVLELPGNIQMTPCLIIEAVKPGLKIDMNTTGVEKSLRASYITVQGEQEWECLSWLSTQRLLVELPAGIKVKEISYHESGYPVSKGGSFVSDDAFMNQLWEESYNTLVICMRDNFMDCPDRERAQWWGDVTSQLLEMFYTMDNSATLLYKKGVDQVLGFRRTDPEDEFYHVLRTVVPVNREVIEIPQQELYGIVGFWYYYLYQGEIDFLKKIYEPAVSYLKLWEMEESGLVSHRAGTMDWADWGKHKDNRIIENAWYYWALNSVREMAGVLSETKDLAFLDERINSISEVFNETFWNGSAYYDAVDNKIPDDRAQAIPVLAGLAKEDQYSGIREVLMSTYNSSPYMENFVQQALYQMGYAEDAMQRLKSQYATFIEDEWTTVGEFFDINFEGMKEKDIQKYYSPTHNHAWSSCALNLMAGNAAGIRPTAPGYQAWQVIPSIGTLREIVCTVPAVIGSIEVSINCTEDDALTLQVISPGNSAEIWVPVKEGQTISSDSGAEYLRNESKFGNTYAVYGIDEAGQYLFAASNVT